MRKSDKKLNISKVNLLAEQRYLESKGLVTEYSKNLEELQEELGDVYLIIIYLQNLEK